MKRLESRLVCIPFVGDTIGGSHLSAITFANTLVNSEYNVLFVLHQKGVLSDYLKKKGFRFLVLELPDITGRHSNVIVQVAGILRNLPVLMRFIRKHKIDLIHTHDARMHLTWSLAALLLRVPHVWHQRTVWSAGRLPEILVRFSSQVVVISEFAKKSLPGAVKANSIVISNPIRSRLDPTLVLDLKATLKQTLGWDSDCKLVAMVGNLLAVKQPMLFIEAGLTLLEKSDECILFLVVGDDRDGFLPQMRARISDAGRMRHFYFMGFRDDANEIIAASDLLVATSKADAFGRTLVEAMVAGVPVVATDAGGHAEIILHGETGYLAPDNDADALAKGAYELLFNSGLRKKLIASARERALRYSPLNHEIQMRQVYARVLR